MNALPLLALLLLSRRSSAPATAPRFPTQQLGAGKSYQFRYRFVDQRNTETRAKREKIRAGFKALENPKIATIRSQGYLPDSDVWMVVRRMNAPAEWQFSKTITVAGMRAVQESATEVP